MGLFRKWNEVQVRNDQVETEICPNCSGKGFFQHGLEFAYIHECSACEGTGMIHSGMQ